MPSRSDRRDVTRRDRSVDVAGGGGAACGASSGAAAGGAGAAAIGAAAFGAAAFGAAAIGAAAIGAAAIGAAAIGAAAFGAAATGAAAIGGGAAPAPPRSDRRSGASGAAPASCPMVVPIMTPKRKTAATSGSIEKPRPPFSFSFVSFFARCVSFCRPRAFIVCEAGSQMGSPDAALRQP